MNILLVSTYELGRQPFGLASPAAWLRRAGFEVAALDLSQCRLDEDAVRAAQLICFYLPMHTATRIAVRAIAKVRAVNPEAHICCYGLYAPMNEELLRGIGVKTILGGEFEAELVEVASHIAQSKSESEPPRAQRSHEGQEARASSGSVSRLMFIVPDRAGLPALEKYARLKMPDGSERVVGYTEATRGCKHRCRHCPIVPVYDGVFRVVQRDVVVEDIRRQVAAGAQHITFGDPDFFNGPAHAVGIVEALHREFPGLSYDVTIKVEHLLKHADLLPVLRRTGCAFVTSAVESVDDRVLELLDKGHTRADFARVVARMREAELPLSPTFVAFTPWTTLQSHADLLRTVAELRLVDNVAPVQWAIRLLIPAGSRLLELDEVRELIGEFDREALSYRWANPDARVDELQRRIAEIVEEKTLLGESRASVFEAAWNATAEATARHGNRDPGGSAGLGPAMPPGTGDPPRAARVTIPYLTEPWYC